MITGYHPAGTGRMGPSDDRWSVMGPDFRVRGVPNLREAGASAFRATVSVNIAPVCMTVGLRGARMLVKNERL